MPLPLSAITVTRCRVRLKPDIERFYNTFYFLAGVFRAAALAGAFFAAALAGAFFAGVAGGAAGGAEDSG